MNDTGLRDFDFLMGAWRVFHRRLKARLAGSTTWEEFDGTCAARKILGAQGNIDDNVINIPGGTYRAATMRAFDPAMRRWAIWWLDARSPRSLDAPVVGAFEDGVGTFYAEDNLGDLPIRVRFLWTRISSASPRWEQAFSPDAGATWETNWTMDFTRDVQNEG